MAGLREGSIATDDFHLADRSGFFKAGSENRMTKAMHQVTATLTVTKKSDMSSRPGDSYTDRNQDQWHVIKAR